jgi:tRNA(Ile)-lysidine synthase
MFQKICTKIYYNFPLIREEFTLLAISGGIDSMVMLDIFQKMKANFAVVHCNFKLRGEESDLDEKLVIDYCKKHQIKYFVESFDTKIFANQFKLSIQEAARELRYAFFTELMIKNNFANVITAHNLNDSFETFMINLSRGTGINGLLGIPTINEKIIRPINFLTRDEIEKYAKLYGIKWREDKSNQETKYLRNKIRHEIFPIFKEINPSFLKSFSKTLEHLNNTKTLETDAIVHFYRQFIKIDNKGNLKLHIDDFLDECINNHAYLYGWFHRYGFKDWMALENLLFAENGKRIDGHNCYLIKEKKHLVLKANKFELKSEVDDHYIYTINNEKETVDIGVIFSQEIVNNELKATTNTIYVDFDSIKYPLFLRKKIKGDVIFPTGMEGSKKVSKFFKDQNISTFERESTYILSNKSNEIIWIVGHRQDRRFAVTKNTKNIIKFEIK